MPRTATDFAALEQEVNDRFQRSRDAIMGEPAQVERYQSMFDRSGESGFYDPNGPIRGEGEQPTWEPNPAYIRSLEAMWDATEGDDWGSSEELLASHGLKLERSLYELFFDSREYEDTEHVHRRVFFGHIVQSEDDKPVTFFMLTVPHSHERFELSTAPVMVISQPLSTQE
jgi:hypothetical protein